jgi:eukaryotic-like serine/threonine-protein kinase
MRVKSNLGVNYRDAGRLAGALPLLEEANRAVRKYPKLRWVRGQLLDAYITAGQNDKAVALGRVIFTEDRAALPAGSPQLAGVLAVAGLSLLNTKNWAEAEAVMREAQMIREANEPDDWRTFNTKSMLGGAQLGQKKYAESEPLLKAGYEGMQQRAEKIPPVYKARLTEALDWLIELAKATGKAEDATIVGAQFINPGLDRRHVLIDVRPVLKIERDHRVDQSQGQRGVFAMQHLGRTPLVVLMGEQV